jgi:hypothetical protein
LLNAVYYCYYSEDDYWPTFDKHNVTLVDTKGKGVERVVPAGLVANGQTFDLDVIIFATGFTAFTGCCSFPIAGVGG